jgi:hypothetical protein
VTPNPAKKYHIPIISIPCFYLLRLTLFNSSNNTLGAMDIGMNILMPNSLLLKNRALT